MWTWIYRFMPWKLDWDSSLSAFLLLFTPTMLINPIILACRPAHRAGTSILDGGKKQKLVPRTKIRAKIKRRDAEQKQHKKGKNERKWKSQNEKSERNNARLGAWRSPRTPSVISPEPRCPPCGIPFSIRALLGLGFSPRGHLQHILLVKMSSATSDIHF